MIVVSRRSHDGLNCREMESRFGAFGPSHERNKNDEDEYVLETSESSHLGDEELVDRSNLSKKEGLVKVRRPEMTNDTPDGFDVCKEYGYKYEYTEDDDHEVDDDDCKESIPPSRKTFSSLLFHGLAERTGSANRETNSDVAYNVYILGKQYHPTLDYAPRRDDEASLCWFTYRSNFPEISPYGIVSDAGWGCMLRSAQMLLCQALRMHYCGRSWHPPKSLVQRRRDPFFQDILNWFADFPSNSGSWYSLHNMVAAGIAKYQTLPGEWFGPGTSCHILRDLCEIHQRRIKRNSGLNQNGDWQEVYNDSMKNIYNKDQPMMRVYVAQEGSVYRDVIEELMTKSQKRKEINKNKVPFSKKISRGTRKNIFSPILHPLSDTCDENKNKLCTTEWDTGLLLLIPLRLGLKTFNAKSYSLTLSHIFSFRQSVGCLGGSPRHALWFYGANSDGTKLHGLDPHTIQSAPHRSLVPSEERKNMNKEYEVHLTDDYLRSLNCTNPSTLDFNKIDPSLALGFYCRDRSDFEMLWGSLLDLKEQGKKQNLPELFCMETTAPDYSADISMAMVEMMSSVSNGDIDHDFKENEDSDEDDYIML